MTRPEPLQGVLGLLKGLRGIQPLKRHYWSQLPARGARLYGLTVEKVKIVEESAK